MTGTSTPNRVRMAARMAAGRRVRIDRQQRHDRPRSRPDVRGVDAAVRADEPVRRLGDQHAVLHPHDPAGLAQDDLDLARVAVEALRELDCLRRRGTTVVRSTTAPSALRHDLLGDDQHVIGGERQGARRPLDRVADERAEVVARADLGHTLERDDPDRTAQPTPRRSASVDSTRTRSSGVSRSIVSGPSSST